MDNEPEEILESLGAKKVEKIEPRRMPYRDAKAEAERLNTAAKKFWDSQKDCRIDDRYQIRRDNPEAPADSYVVRLGYFGVHEYDGNVYLTNPCILAGDGRLRNKDGTLYVVPQDHLDFADWHVMDNNWSEW